MRDSKSLVSVLKADICPSEHVFPAVSCCGLNTQHVPGDSHSSQARFMVDETQLPYQGYIPETLWRKNLVGFVYSRWQQNLLVEMAREWDL